MVKIEYTKEGNIKDFSVSNAHHLWVTARHVQTGKILNKEAIALAAPEEIISLLTRIDPQDNLPYRLKWAINKDVINAVLENGECIQKIPGHPMYFEYKLRPMKYKDNLKHRG